MPPPPFERGAGARVSFFSFPPYPSLPREREKQSAYAFSQRRSRSAAMIAAPRVLLFDAAPPRTEKIQARLREKGLSPTHMQFIWPAAQDVPRNIDVAVVVLDQQKAEGQADQIAALLKKLADEKVATLVLGSAGKPAGPTGPLLEFVPAEASLDEVIGRLSMLVRYAPHLKRLDREVAHLQRLTQLMNRYFSEMDQEMRLAGRLQRDFLPRAWPQVANLTFASLYRPATWVSGDMYDAFRIDERHVGVFVADAMGHGVAAGLMTMFLRQALVVKHVEGQRYRIVSPAEALNNLHEALVKQHLPNCQFVTAAYGVLNTATMELCLARAGHPYPLHLTRAGEIHELQPTGGLLGLSDLTPEFTECRATLAPGDKVVFYTDGVEDALIRAPKRTPESQTEFTPHLQEWRGLDAHGFINALCEHLDHREGSLHPADDMSAVALEVAAQ